MVVDLMSDERVDRLFHALADATRRDIVERSMHAEFSVSDLARSYSMSFAAVQKHVAVLDRAGLVTKRKRGRQQLVTSNVEAIRNARRCLDHFEQIWLVRLERFGELLDEPDDGPFTKPESDPTSGHQPGHQPNHQPEQGAPS
jgi:DNA-binding transcriptional ArsR family regulator